MGKFQKGNIPWDKGIPRTEETKLKISKAKKGIPIKALKGRIFSKETRRKMSEARKGIMLSNETRQRMSEYHKGKCLSEKVKKKISKANKGQIPWNKRLKGYKLSEEGRQNIRKAKQGKQYGSNNPNWKNGISSLEHLIRTNFKNRQWISDVFTRDNFICQMCGDNRGGNLNAHHIKNFSKIIQFYEITTLEEAIQCDELWNINNGITLCKKCHIKIHINKKYNFELVGEI